MMALRIGQREFQIEAKALKQLCAFIAADEKIAGASYQPQYDRVTFVLEKVDEEAPQD
ncbi:hypothetical protein LCGC14_1701870 [marine sediment metagenome]|uniref:Uncharacterized protein n=1 Tax=marine sediment metagenome TaxID=412755 RepID=A0A0F9KHQ6_9ZZZZ